jgi:hypothetical protein
MAGMTALLRIARPTLPPIAGTLIYLGERVVAVTPGRWVLTGLGVASLLAAVGWTALLWMRARRGAPHQAASWRAVLLPLLLFLLAAIGYGLTQLSLQTKEWFSVPDQLGFAWALMLSVGAIWFVTLETALWGQDARALDNGRVRRASLAGLNLGLLAAIVFTLNFAVNRMGWQWDITYFKTTEPSQATRDAVLALENPVQVALFFPEGDEVGRLAGGYFRALMTSRPGNLTVNQYDADLKPLQAREFKARGNGMVVLKRDEQLKPIYLGTSLERARQQLREFDGEVFAAVADLARERRMAYFTVGHGERNERNREDAEEESGVTALETLLRGRGYVIKPLGMAQGLGSAVPDDAVLVVISGPTAPFSKGEAQALRAYLHRGGRLLALLEPRTRSAPQAPDPLWEELQAFGIAFENVVLANDRVFARRSFSSADHALLVTNAYGPHPAANTVRRTPDQFPLLALTSGALRRGDAPSDLQLREVVKAMPGTWGDKNGNYFFDGPAEKRQDFVLAMGVGPVQKSAPGKGKAEESVGPRLLVFADADIASDLLMQNRANATLLADAVAWLGGEEAPPGLPASEEDLRIQHAKGDDWLWFYLPVVGVPALVLSAGFYVVGRRRRLIRSGP